MLLCFSDVHSTFSCLNDANQYRICMLIFVSSLCIYTHWMSNDPRKHASLELLIGVTGCFFIFCHVELVVWFSFLTWDGGGWGGGYSLF